MAWLKSHSELEQHPKLLLFKHRMGWSKNEAVGFLHRFWWKVLEYSPDGVVSGLPLEVISESLDINLGQFRRALEEMQKKDVELLDVKDGRVVVHDWLDYTLPYLRDSKWKNHPKRLEEARAIHGLPADDPRMIRGPSGVEEKRGEERRREGLPPPTKGRRIGANLRGANGKG